MSLSTAGSESTRASLFPSMAMARLVVFFAVHPGQRFYLRDLGRRTRLSSASLQRELQRLVDAGAIERRNGDAGDRRVYFAANEEHDAWRGWTLLLRSVAEPADARGCGCRATRPLPPRPSPAGASAQSPTSFGRRGSPGASSPGRGGAGRHDRTPSCGTPTARSPGELHTWGMSTRNRPLVESARAGPSRRSESMPWSGGLTHLPALGRAVLPRSPCCAPARDLPPFVLRCSSAPTCRLLPRRHRPASEYVRAVRYCCWIGRYPTP
jgi:hypothetical protein